MEDRELFYIANSSPEVRVNILKNLETRYFLNLIAS